MAGFLFGPGAQKIPPEMASEFLSPLQLMSANTSLLLASNS